MYKLKFKLAHKGCYATDLSKKFPEYVMLVNDFQMINQQRVQVLLFITGGPKNFDAISDFLKNHTRVYEVHELERTAEHLFLELYIHREKLAANIVFSNDCFILEIVKLVNGFEYWTLGATKKDNFNKIIEELKKLGEVKVLYIGKVALEGYDLTEKQKAALKLAYENGYYNFPRKISAEKLANKSGKAKSTYAEHLHTAERKIIEKVMESL